MVRLFRRGGLLAAAALLGVLLAACSTFVTGGGWLPSAVPGEKATVGFAFRCDAGGDDCASGRARGTYHDPAAGVRLMFDGIVAATGATAGSDNCFQGTVGYTVPGGKAPAGTVAITACDHGEPGRGGDTVALTVRGGPHDGYQNAGTLRGGNIQAR